MGIQLSDVVENIVGKEEIARYEQFLLFTQCFQKLSVVDASKWVSMELRVKGEGFKNTSLRKSFNSLPNNEILDLYQVKALTESNVP